MKKTGAIVGLILSSIALVVLCSIFTVLMSMDSLKNISFGFMSISYENEDSYSIGESDIEQKITSLDIEWISGDVTVEVYTGDAVQIRETSASRLDEDDLLRYRVDNGKLTVKPCKSMWFFGINSLPSKSLKILVPYESADDFNSVEIEVTSASVDISAIKAREFDLTTVSGRINGERLTADEISAETVSGDVKIGGGFDKLDYEGVSGALTFNGTFDSFDGETVSGNIRMDLKSVPKEIDCESVSGDIRIDLPDGAEFGGKFDTVSGDFICEFTGKIGKNSFDCGKSSGYSFESVSGDIEIRKSNSD